MTKYTIPNWRDEDCASTFYLLEIIQRKHIWNILAILCLKWPHWFWELLRELEPISSKVLSQQLKYLTYKQLLSKENYMEWKVKKSIYTLTYKPEEFKNILSAFKLYVNELPVIKLNKIKKREI